MPTYLGHVQDGTLGAGELYSEGCELVFQNDWIPARQPGGQRISLCDTAVEPVAIEEVQTYEIVDRERPSYFSPISNEPLTELPAQEQVSDNGFNYSINARSVLIPEAPEAPEAYAEEEAPINLEYGEYASRLALTIIPVADIPTQFVMPEAVRKVMLLAEKYPQLKIASYDDNKIYFIDDPISYPSYYEDYLLEISDVINSDYELPFIVGISVTPISEEDFKTYYSLTPTESDQVDTIKPIDQIDEQDSFTRGFALEDYAQPAQPISAIPPWEENPDDYYFRDGEYKRQSEIEANPFYQDCADGSTQQSMLNDLIWTGGRWELQEPCWDHGGSLQAMIDAEGRATYEQSLAYDEGPIQTQEQRDSGFNRAYTYNWLRQQGYDNATANAMLQEYGYR